MDDGKSTLIGRLLLDTGSIQADTLREVEALSRRRGRDDADLSLLTDGLVAEQARGITIDVAHRHFEHGGRHYLIADAPGHEEYTRNMVTAASTARAAVILVDVQRGVRLQTRRHLHVAHLAGVAEIVVAVNKMDLAGWSEEAFRSVKVGVQALCEGLGIARATFVPVSALAGDMVVRRGGRLPWYDGPTLLDVLAAIPVGADAVGRPFRFPVQWVTGGTGGGELGGRVESGFVTVGDEVVVGPAGIRSHVAGIRLGLEARRDAVAGESVFLALEGAAALRGELVAAAVAPPRVVRALEATLVWFSERPLLAGQRFLLRHGPGVVGARVARLDWRMDLHDLARVPADGLSLNDVGRVALALDGAIACDRYADDRATGSLILVDEESGDTVAGGMME